MALVDALLISIALAMDCFMVSITCGIIQRRMGRQSFYMASSFGLFQSGMALLGWCFVGFISHSFHLYDHWVAFALLALIGGKMIWEGAHPKEHQKFNPSKFIVVIMLSIATSIDALAVGCSFVAMELVSFASIFIPILLIGVMSFSLSLLGKCIGVKIGHRVDWPVEQIAGVILILIGLKALLQ